MSRSNQASYDIIFAGGGASACVTAGRLAAADPELRILILEAGPETYGIQEHVQPARYFRSLALPRDTFSFNLGKPSVALAGRAPLVPSGRCLGGGSSVNFTMYTRAAASDYDDWENVYGNAGWGSKDLIPLLKKVETFQAKVNPSNDTHGFSGPIKVSYAEESHNVGLQFLEAAKQYDQKRDFTDDLNGFFSCNAYSRWPRYIDIRSGRRSDAPHHFIYDQGHKNLDISTRKCVIRILFEGTRAVGVEYVDDDADRTHGLPTPQTVYASRLVVVSAGAFGSPAILERSGIGSGEVLKNSGVEQLVDLPGVGENYLDHNLIFAPYLASEDAETLDTVFRGKEEQLTDFAAQWHENGKGLLASNGLDAGIKIRPDEEDLKELGPEFQPRWKEYFLNALDKPVCVLVTLSSYVGADSSIGEQKVFSMTYYTCYPASVGRIHITSGANPYAPIEFEPGFLDEPEDLSVLRWMYKKSRELARRMRCYRGEFIPGHPQYPEGSKAASNAARGAVPIDADDVVYTKEDDDAIDTYHRETVATTWHSIGTCAMKPREDGGVVDARLNVYGTTNLKVADCSITPANVGANTYNTALAIGEKAAVLIAEDLGIKGV